MTEPIRGHVELRLHDHYCLLLWRLSRTQRVVCAGVLVWLFVTLVLEGISRGIHHLWENNASGLAIILAGIGFLLGLRTFYFSRFSQEQRRLTYEIDHERITVRDGAGATVVWPWSQVKSCHERPPGFLFLVRPMGVNWLIRRAFGSEELERFRVLAKEQLGDAAHMRRGKK